MMREPSTRLIMECVAAAFEVPVKDILSHRKTATILSARYAVYLLAKELTSKSVIAIGNEIGGRDHKTICVGASSAEAMLRHNEPFRTLVDASREAVRAIASSSLSDSFEDADALAIAEITLADPTFVSMRITPTELKSLAAQFLAHHRAAVLTLKLLAAIAADAPLSTITADLSQALKDIGHSKQEKVNVELAAG